MSPLANPLYLLQRFRTPPAGPSNGSPDSSRNAILIPRASF